MAARNLFRTAANGSYLFWVMVGVAALSITLLASQSEPSDEAVLTALDAARFVLADSLSFTVDTEAERPDGAKQATVKLFFKEIEGQDYSRIEFLAPPELRGQIYLNTPEGTYFYGPDLDEPLLVSGGQRVFGDATVAQTVGIRFEGDYKITERKKIALPGGAAGLEISLAGTSNEVTFPTILVTADEATLRPISMRVFALSGDPVNQVAFEEYAELDGDLYAKRQLIESLIQTENKTLLTITEITAEELSDDLFDPDKLGKKN